MTDAENPERTRGNTGPMDQGVARGDYLETWAHYSEGDIAYLIRQTQGYIVFLDRDGYLEWETTPEFDRTETEAEGFDLESQNEIHHGIAIIEAIPCDGLLKSTRTQFKRLLGEALVFSFDADYSGARRMLESARSYIQARGEETSRDWHLTASIAAAAGSITVGIAAWIWRESFWAQLGVTAHTLTLAAVAGAVGGLLSVILRAGDLRLDFSAGRRLHYVEGASRICVGAISGLLVALGIKSGLILSVADKSESLFQVILFFAMISGTSERFVKSIVSNFDDTLNRSDDSRQIAARRDSNET